MSRSLSSCQYTSGMNCEQASHAGQQSQSQLKGWYADPRAAACPIPVCSDGNNGNNNNDSSSSLLSIRLMSHPLLANQSAQAEESDRLLLTQAVTSSLCGDVIANPDVSQRSDEPLTKRLGVPRLLPMEFVTNNKNRVTNFVVSIIVAIFFNFVFGGIAIVLSIKAHNLLTQKKGENFQKRAAVYGNLAFVFNALGIVSTMLFFIYLFSHPTVVHVARFIKHLNIGDVEDHEMGNAVRSSFEFYSKSQ